MKKFIPILVVVIAILAIGIGVWYATRPEEDIEHDFSEDVKAEHVLDSTPMPQDRYVVQPINITINTNIDIKEGSQISVSGGAEAEWTTGETVIEDNKTVLQKDLMQGMQDGEYLVLYNICFTNGSCEEGNYKFTIDSKGLSEYTDLRGKEAVEIEMKSLAFSPTKAIVSPGTKVTWINKEDVEHFVNTGTHPEHTYFTQQNSGALKVDEDFSTIFVVPGQYDYHCSAHVPQNMTGVIVVKE